MSMNAFITTAYGRAISVMKMETVEIPVPKPNQVLVKTKAVSINSSDIEYSTGHPGYVRMLSPFRPQYRINGSDISGLVESVGSATSKFKPGDAVFCDVLYSQGGFAQYVCVDESKLVEIPKGLSFVQAACIPQGGSVAWQALSSVKPGDSVLINGAGGGSGHFAIQMARLKGADSITAIDNNEKLDFMKSLGADACFDYKTQDATKLSSKFDVIIDFVSTNAFFNYKNVLKPTGEYKMVGGLFRNILKVGLFGGGGNGSPKFSLFQHDTNNQLEDLKIIAEKVLEGKIRINIDQIFEFKDVPKAVEYVANGHSKGKVVVEIN
jgi:NADPH:quinone reductase-like Zn-dependent oxidoreductase